MRELGITQGVLASAVDALLAVESPGSAGGGKKKKRTEQEEEDEDLPQLDLPSPKDLPRYLVRGMQKVRLSELKWDIAGAAGQCRPLRERVWRGYYAALKTSGLPANPIPDALLWIDDGMQNTEFRV